MEVKSVQSTEDKLAYLLETKNLIKQAINNKGRNIQDTDTFRQYVNEINLIVTGSGTDTSDATAEAADLISGKTAYVNGVKLNGTLEDLRNETARAHTSVSSVSYSDSLGKLQVIINEKATLLKAASASVAVRNEATANVEIDENAIALAIGLTADKIKEGETVLGITGTYKGEIDPDEYNQASNTLNDIIGE